MERYKIEVERSLNYARQNCFKFVFVEADPQKGFNYSYLAYIPNTPQKTLILDCLNDYEPDMPCGWTENPDGLDEVYGLFQATEIIRSSASRQAKKAESKDRTLNRLYYRLTRAINTIGNMIDINPAMPAIVPLVPGYNNEQFRNVASQLDKGVVNYVAPQIKAIIEDAAKLIKGQANVTVDNKVILLGHSKSADFANNFSTYYPEMCEACILGGGNFGTIPLSEIVLEVVPDERITDNEKFYIKNKTVTKRVAQQDIDKIASEYSQMNYTLKKKIDANGNAQYYLPLNFPLGIADIENYRGFSSFPNGKSDYRKYLSSIPKMVFVGENEDIKPGHYAYRDSVTTEGISVQAGEDILLLSKKLGRIASKIEPASMHNRVLEYINTISVLFGRSTNERLINYMQLYDLLDAPIQSKIYAGVGHTDYRYSDEIDDLDGFSSNGIYRSRPLKNDIALFCNNVINGGCLKLSDEGRANQISPIPQLIRRYIASGNSTELLRGVSEGQMMQSLQKYIGSKADLRGKNIFRVYDNLSASEISSILQMAKRAQK